MQKKIIISLTLAALATIANTTMANEVRESVTNDVALSGQEKSTSKLSKDNKNKPAENDKNVGTFAIKNAVNSQNELNLELAQSPTRQQRQAILAKEDIELKKATGPKKGVKAASMPGIGVMPGDTPELENVVLSVTSKRTELVRVSASLTNRISTPFKNPRAILLEGGSSVEAVGQSLYFAPNNDTKPVSLYVTGGGDNDPVISLTLIPTHDLPPQTIILQMDGKETGYFAGGENTGRNDDVRSPVYTEKITAILRLIALGKTPSGFALAPLPKSDVNLGLVTAIPTQRYSGSNMDVYRYVVKANSNQELEMEEAAFWTKGVRAVAFFPSSIVAPNKDTEVLIVADKTSSLR